MDLGIIFAKKEGFPEKEESPAINRLFTILYPFGNRNEKNKQDKIIQSLTNLCQTNRKDKLLLISRAMGLPSDMEYICGPFIERIKSGGKIKVPNHDIKLLYEMIYPYGNFQGIETACQDIKKDLKSLCENKNTDILLMLTAVMDLRYTSKDTHVSLCEMLNKYVEEECKIGKPDPRIPDIIKDIEPTTFAKLCLINEELKKKLGNKMGASCDETRELPSLTIPKELLVFDKMFGDDDDILMYGTSHIKKLLTFLNRGDKLNELEELEKESAESRRNMLNELLQNERVITNEYPRFMKPKEFRKMLLNVWISEETFRTLYPLVNKIHDNITYEELDNIVREFIGIVIQNDDYLVNWGLFPLLVDMDGELAYQDEEIQYFIKNLIKEIRTSLIKSIEYDKFAPRDKNFIRTIPKGTLFYRGYKTYRGPANLKKNFAWFAFDIPSTMYYIIPPKREDNKGYLAENIDFTNSNIYCGGVGGVATFRLIKDVKVVDFADINALKMIKAELYKQNADKDIISAFESGWIFNAEDDKFKRNSLDVLDAKVAEWLCKNGYGGYIAVGLGKFHDEVMICSLTDSLEYVGDYDPRTSMNFHVCSEPYSLQDTTLMYW